ncbi:19911_t:CDS:2, partial [Rhizophagus irregularis]
TNQQLSTSNTTDIGPFKNELEICLYISQRPELVSLTLNMMKASGHGHEIIQEKPTSRFCKFSDNELGVLQLHLKCLFFRTRVINNQIINELVRSLFPNIEMNGMSDLATLHMWALRSYRDYNMIIRRELRNLVPEFIRKYRQPTMQQISEYITEKKTFKDQPRNTTAFTKFIHSAFNMFIQENLLEAESLQLQYIASLHNKNDSNKDLQDGLLNNDQEYETLEQFCNSKSDFSMSSDELNNSEWSDTLDHEANQKTSDDLTDSEELINMEVIQETIEGKTKFEPLPATKGYDDLICILKHPNFRTEHIIENVRRLRLLCNRLPLQTVKSHSIYIQNMKTPSTSKPFKDAYTISDKRTRIGRIIAIVSTSSDVKLKIQVLYYCDELPNNFRKLSRVQEAENGELWLSEVTSLINKDNIIEPIAVWLQDSLHLSNYQFYVEEILYSYEGRWKIRNVELRHHHPQKFHPLLLKIYLH